MQRAVGGLRFYVMIIAVLGDTGVGVAQPVVEPVREPAVSTLNQNPIPMVAVEGDLALTSWGPTITAEPAITVTRLSTGETLWMVKAAGEEAVAAWLNKDAVIVAYLQRDNRSFGTTRIEWRDAVSGNIRHERTPVDPQFQLSVLTSLAVADDRTVLDRRTGEVRGQLPEGVWYSLLEQGDRLFGIRYVDSQFEEFVAMDASTFAILHRIEKKPSWLERPLLHDGSRVLIRHYDPVFYDSVSWSKPSKTIPLAVFDLEAGELLWKTEVPPSAPVWMVDDLSVDPSGLGSQPTILIDWQTGRQRVTGDERDRALWLLPKSPPRLIRRYETSATLFGPSVEGFALIGVDAEYREFWRREGRPLPNESLVLSSPFRYSESGDYAVEFGGAAFEIVDLRTGEVTKVIDVRTLGLPRIPPRDESSSDGTLSHMESLQSAPWWSGRLMPVGFITIGLLIYLLIRSILMRSRGGLS